MCEVSVYGWSGSCMCKVSDYVFVWPGLSMCTVSHCMLGWLGPSMCKVSVCLDGQSPVCVKCLCVWMVRVQHV